MRGSIQASKNLTEKTMMPAMAAATPATSVRKYTMNKPIVFQMNMAPKLPNPNPTDSPKEILPAALLFTISLCTAHSCGLFYCRESWLCHEQPAISLALDYHIFYFLRILHEITRAHVVAKCGRELRPLTRPCNLWPSPRCDRGPIRRR